MVASEVEDFLHNVCYVMFTFVIKHHTVCMYACK